MNNKIIEKILRQLKNGKITIKEAAGKFNDFPFYDMGFAKVDTHREIRKGFPEIVFCQGKKIDQIVKICKKYKKETPFMATRADMCVYEAVREARKDVVYYEKARIIFAGKRKRANRSGKSILVLSAGTSDIPVAEEAAVTSEIMGNKVERIYDMGAAGIHRMLKQKKRIDAANVIIVVAGMDAVLPTLVGGLARRPVIAVPTSVGYGASFKGLAALLTVLNSCAPGIAAVNIDNGFGAGYMAALINRQSRT